MNMLVNFQISCLMRKVLCFDLENRCGEADLEFLQTTTMFPTSCRHTPANGELPDVAATHPNVDRKELSQVYSMLPNENTGVDCVSKHRRGWSRSHSDWTVCGTTVDILSVHLSPLLFFQWHRRTSLRLKRGTFTYASAGSTASVARQVCL